MAMTTVTPITATARMAARAGGAVAAVTMAAATQAEAAIRTGAAARNGPVMEAITQSTTWSFTTGRAMMILATSMTTMRAATREVAAIWTAKTVIVTMAETPLAV